MRRILCMVTLMAALAACSSRPKYPNCGGDKDCREGEHCVNKQCLQCGTDAHCKPGQKCEKGACVDEDDGKQAGDDALGKPCKVDDDCADDEDCIAGRCKKPWQEGGGAAGDPGCRLESVYFGYDQFTVSAEGGELLSKAAECLQSAADRSVSVVGHTDPRGTEEYNIALSERRGRAVADYLSRLGIDPARMPVVPKGESESQGTDEGSYEKDRRVDFEWR